MGRDSFAWPEKVCQKNFLKFLELCGQRSLGLCVGSVTCGNWGMWSDGCYCQSKIKVLAPSRTTVVSLTCHNFSWSFNHEIAFPMLYFLTTKRFSLLAPFGIVCSVGEKKKINQIRSNLTLQIPALLNSWVLGKVWINWSSVFPFLLLKWAVCKVSSSAEFSLTP